MKIAGIYKYFKNILPPAFLLLYSISVRGQETEFTNLEKDLQDKFGNSYGFSVLIADDNKIVFSKAFGYIDSLKTKLSDEQTLYNIASITKSFTAIGIMKLAEQKKLNLTDTIGKFFDNVPADKRAITINELLSHKSGFQQNYVCDGITSSGEALKALLADTLGFAAGTEFDYSNQNYEMLSLILEEVTNSTYENFIRKEILNPLDMSNTIFWDEAGNYENIAGKNRILSDSITGRNWGFIGSGGIYSTPADLYKFIDAVINKKLVSAESLELIFTEYNKTPGGIGIGYGWFINDSTAWNTKEIWTRGNEDFGHNAVIRWFPEKKTIIIVCTNSGEMGDKQTTGNRIVSDYIADYLWKKKN